jgi:hypothetical protein
LLRVLLARPEPKTSDHPSAEDLANYLENRSGAMPLTKLEAHVAGCPLCFAGLSAIREYLQPGASQGETPPDWIVARAARNFHPPQAFLDLGTLLVRWLNRIGPSLRLISPSERGPSLDPAFVIGAEPAIGAFEFPHRALFSIGISDELDNEEPVVGECPPMAAGKRSPVEPVSVTIGHLKVRITPQGRTREHVSLTVSVTRSTDNAPVSGVQFSLVGDEGSLAAVTSGDNGVAEFPLPQGQAKLVFQSPVRAELQISF